jgi:hypothetical protein
MPEYVLDHHREGEGQRLALMSRLLDPMHRRYLERLGVGPGARTLEVGCGNGSMSALRPRLLDSGQLDSRSIDTFLTQYADPAWWTQTIAFTAAHGRKPE